MKKLPPPLTSGQVPRDGRFDVVFWPDDGAPMLCVGMRANKTVMLMDPETDRMIGYALATSERLWSSWYHEDLVEAHEAGRRPADV